MKHEKFSDEEIAAKTAAGLSYEQAIQVLEAQATHDKAIAEASEPSGVEVTFSESKPKEQT
jgi:hypothetical protein